MQLLLRDLALALYVDDCEEVLDVVMVGLNAAAREGVPHARHALDHALDVLDSDEALLKDVQHPERAQRFVLRRAEDQHAVVPHKVLEVYLFYMHTFFESVRSISP